jgi:hypothetical protein
MNAADRSSRTVIDVIELSPSVACNAAGASMPKRNSTPRASSVDRSACPVVG